MYRTDGFLETGRFMDFPSGDVDLQNLPLLAAPDLDLPTALPLVRAYFRAQIAAQKFEASCL